MINTHTMSVANSEPRESGTQPRLCGEGVGWGRARGDRSVRGRFIMRSLTHPEGVLRAFGQHLWRRDETRVATLSIDGCRHVRRHYQGCMGRKTKRSEATHELRYRQ